MRFFTYNWDRGESSGEWLKERERGRRERKKEDRRERDTEKEREYERETERERGYKRDLPSIAKIPISGKIGARAGIPEPDEQTPLDRHVTFRAKDLLVCLHIQQTVSIQLGNWTTKLITTPLFVFLFTGPTLSRLFTYITRGAENSVRCSVKRTERPRT